MKHLDRIVHYLTKDSTTLNSVKNLGQFLIGVMIFYAIHGHVPWPLAAIGGLSFLLTYAAVYPFNDLMDYEEDREDPSKEWKALARGSMTKKQAAALSMGLLLTGFALTAFLTKSFQLLLVGLLITNFLHSSDYLRFKDSIYLTGPNMALMQTLKFSSGWFAIGGSLQAFPLALMVSLGAGYAFTYFKYKGYELDSLHRKGYIYLLLLISAIAFIYAFFAYEFKVLFLLFTVYGTVLFLLYKTKYRGTSQDRFGVAIFSLFLILVVTSFFIVNTETGTELNQKIDKRTDVYTDSLEKEVTPLETGIDRLVDKMDAELVSGRDYIDPDG